MALSSVRDLDVGKTYKIVYHGGKEQLLGKLKEIKPHMDTHWLTYGSPTRLSDMLVFEKYTLLQDSVFPINDWEKISAPKLYIVSSGGRRRNRSTRKHAKKSHKRRHSSKKHTNKRNSK